MFVKNSIGSFGQTPFWAVIGWIVGPSMRLRVIGSNLPIPSQREGFCGYRSGTVNSNTVNSKFHLIRSFFEIFARFLSFHVYNAQLIQSSTNLK